MASALALLAALAGCGGGQGSGRLPSPGPAAVPRSLDNPLARQLAAEPTVTQTMAPRIAALALRYQPILVVAQADRFWPISVQSLLKLGGGRSATCIEGGASCTPLTNLGQLGPGGGDGRFLRYPVAPRDPQAQFEGFVAALGIDRGRLASWATDKGANPYPTAQEYFYLARRAPPPGPGLPALPGQLNTLEYWFFYGYNYLPKKIGRLSELGTTPDRAVAKYVDLHEGDWEHIDVLVDRRSGEPRYVLMARHDSEDQLFAWDDARVHRGGAGGTHPVIDAGFGGHASYERCGIQLRSPTRTFFQRVVLGVRLFDYTVCPNPPLQPPLPPGPAGATFAFPETTPLVELRPNSWACWKGHFGARLIRHSLGPLDLLRPVGNGPLAPLRQKENKRVCSP